MGLFSNLFRRKTIKVVETRLGQFTLMHVKKDKCIWSNKNNVYMISVRGTEDEPNSEQLKFVENMSNEIQKLSDKITKRFFREFKDAEIEIDFKSWQERFRIVATDVMMIFEEEGYWNITFEDLKRPFAHFTLFIEGEKLTDFAIDT